MFLELKFYENVTKIHEKAKLCSENSQKNSKNRQICF